jgi:hypothetical protein
MAREIAAHRRAMQVRADPALDHAQHGRALLVGDAVERVFDLVLSRHRLADAPRRQQRVVRHRVERALEPVQVGEEFGFQRRGRLALRPARERLVEPDVVPPGDGREIAEPLVRDLVRRHVEDRALHAGRRGRIEPQQRIAEHDQAGVLHRAGGEIRRAEQVELVERERLLRVVFEEIDDCRRLAQDPAQLRCGAARPDCTQRQRARAHGVRRQRRSVDDVPGPDREGDQIGRQRLRGRIRDRLEAAAGIDLVARARVRERDRGARHRERDVERRLEARLVESRKRVARADRFQLRDDVGVLADADLVQALQLRVERR